MAPNSINQACLVLCFCWEDDADADGFDPVDVDGAGTAMKM
jgi:hypothetical protein